MIIENLTIPNSPPQLGHEVRIRVSDMTLIRPWSSELVIEILSRIDVTDFERISVSDFRALFTIEEQVLLDNYFDNPAISADQKAILRSAHKNLEANVADGISLSSPNVVMFVRFLADQGIGATPACGFISSARADQILSNGVA